MPIALNLEAARLHRAHRDDLSAEAGKVDTLRRDLQSSLAELSSAKQRAASEAPHRAQEGITTGE